MVIKISLQLHKLDMFRSDKTFKSCITTHITSEYICTSTLELGKHSRHKMSVQKDYVLLEEQQFIDGE